MHDLHHASPNAFIGTPTWLSFVCFGVGGFAPLWFIGGLEIASGAVTGLMIGYIWYLVVHDAVHRWRLDHESFLYRAKLRHAAHHYGMQAGNFGVTTAFWDRVFGITIFGARERRVPLAATWPLSADAQQTDQMRRIGVLMNNAEDDPESKAQLGAFQQGLQQLGWTEGRNIRIYPRFAADRPDQHQVLAKELIALQPDAIFAYTTQITAALQRESRKIPIVFMQVSDPVGSGLVASLARPSGNLTGLLLYEKGITSKWVAMLKEIAPHLERAALLANPKTTPYDYFVRSAEAIAPSLAIELVPSPIENAAEIERVIEAFAGAPNGGLLVLPSGTITLHRDLVIALAARHRLPSVYPFRFLRHCRRYSTGLVDQSRQAASYVDRILRGANPAELPVQAPTKYVTTVNLKTPKALGLEVPSSLLVRADEVIE